MILELSLLYILALFVGGILFVIGCEMDDADLKFTGTIFKLVGGIPYTPFFAAACVIGFAGVLAYAALRIGFEVLKLAGAGLLAIVSAPFALIGWCFGEKEESPQFKNNNDAVIDLAIRDGAKTLLPVDRSSPEYANLNADEEQGVRWLDESANNFRPVTVLRP